MNFPHNHRLYVGSHWSESLKDGFLDSADVILVLDCDVPWIKGVFRPSVDAAVYHIDCDPLKINMSLFHIDTELSCQADTLTAVQQLNSYLMAGSELTMNGSAIAKRSDEIAAAHNAYIASVLSKESIPVDDTIITPHYALSRLREHLSADALVLSEGISNYRPICDVMMRSVPGTYFTSGATSLGWHGGAAFGAKLAFPEKTVVAITGDGSFMFSIPETVHWMSRRYNAPFLTVVLNNRGWKSPMLSVMAVHQQGYSRNLTSDQLHVTFDPSCDHAQVAVAAGAGYGIIVKNASEIDAAIRTALATVSSGRSAVIDIWLPKFKVGDHVG